MTTAAEAQSTPKALPSRAKPKSPSQTTRLPFRDVYRGRARRHDFPSRSVDLSAASATPSSPGQGAATVSSPANAAWKRRLDVTCVMLSLPVVLPLMAFIILWVRLVSRGPALFRQERVGQDGKRFVLYKFRSMKLNASTGRHEAYLRHLVKSDSPMIKLDLLCDSRLIPGGCLLRAAGLDELPQLINVLRGEMSLVGPRPCLPQEHAFFSPRQKERFKALPGLTGTWQVSGKNQCTFSEMNEMDIHYVNHASARMDLAIMFRTPAALLRQIGQALRLPTPPQEGKAGEADREYAPQRLTR